MIRANAYRQTQSVFKALAAIMRTDVITTVALVNFYLPISSQVGDVLAQHSGAQ